MKAGLSVGGAPGAGPAAEPSSSSERTIVDELGRALISTRAMDADRRPPHRAQIDDSVPDFVVSGYERLIDSIELPDPDDRHVAAAAIRCHASVIVTYNLSDFRRCRSGTCQGVASSPAVVTDHGFLGNGGPNRALTATLRLGR